MSALGGIFLLSGAAALIIETTWLGWFRLLLGATAPAASATLVAFFAGHAIGAFGGARLAARSRRPLRLYAVLEAGAALGALAMPLLLTAADAGATAIYESVAARPLLLTAARFGVALAASLPAAMCLGATWPAMASAVVARQREMGSKGSALYALNTIGAALGAAAASFFLPMWLGVNGSYSVGIGLSLTAACAAAWLMRSESPATHRSGTARTRAKRASAKSAAAHGSAPLSPAHHLPALPAALLALAALSGFGHFAAQVLLIQSFSMVLNQSVFAFGSVLVCVLTSLAMGAGLVAWSEKRRILPSRRLLGIALSLSALGLAVFPAALHAATDGLHFVGSEAPWPGYVFAAMGATLLCAGPALLGMGMVLPLTFALAGTSEAGPHSPDTKPGSALGVLTAVNTAGALAGAVAGPYLLLPAAGLWGALLCLAAVYTVPALAALFSRDVLAREGKGSARWLPGLAFAAGWAIVLGVANPLSLAVERLAPGERLVEQRVGAAGVVSVLEKDGERWIRTDGHYALGGTSDTVHEERQGHLPLLLHRNPKRVAFVGTATGASAGAALAHDIEELYLIEIVPSVAEVAMRHFAKFNRGVYGDPRSVVILDDARNFLARTAKRFDVIVADLFVPWRSGTGALYTTEHFLHVRERLREDGLFCQWLPLYQLSGAELDIVINTFSGVFPTGALFRGDFYGAYPVAALIGWAGSPPTAAQVSSAAAALGERGERDRWVTDPLGIWALFAAPLGPARGDAPRNSDGHPRIQFMAAQTHHGGSIGKRDAIVGVDWVRRVERAREQAPAGSVRLFADMDAAIRRAAAGGAALQLAGALYADGRTEEASRAFAVAAERLPARLVARGEADPTAAELWHER